jgi:hypothetical protein
MTNCLMTMEIPSRKVIDYKVVAFDDVTYQLEHGWHLYGNPFSGASHGFYQAMVKYAPPLLLRKEVNGKQNV